MEEDKPIEELTKEEITEAMLTSNQPSIHEISESGSELKAMGVRDIKELEASEQEAMKEAMKNIQIQRTLDDYRRGSIDKKSIKEYLEDHITFLTRISPGKQKSDIAKNLTYEHASAILKITAKMTDIPEKLLKKHIKQIKRKYSS